jgi:hypothetical protein
VNPLAAPLGLAQASAATHRRKSIYGMLHPETNHGGNAGPSGEFRHTDKSGFTKPTAEATGKSERSVRQGNRVKDLVTKG